MPELPEVETTCRGIRPYLENRRIDSVEILNPSLRVPVGVAISTIANFFVSSVSRRAKYILINGKPGTIIIHLGMSGSLRVADPTQAIRKHDHAIFRLDSGRELRFHDPRRFGLIVWNPVGDALNKHPLLRHLGPEPLADDFNGETLFLAARGRKTAIKSLIMNNSVLVGVGNIYACEALFLAGIHPNRSAGEISGTRITRLTNAIKDRLQLAIAHGGTSLRDFVGGDGKPGYFLQELNVYGREDEPCRICATPIRRIPIGQRSTFFCPGCQR